MKKVKIICIVLVAVIAISLAGCSGTQKGVMGNVTTTDYSVKEHWLRSPESADKAVDVFYLYPTSWVKKDESEPNICEIDNAVMLLGSEATYSAQATVFEESTNVFAPYYRQADAQYCLSLSQEDQTKLLSGEPKADVFAALDYYFKNLNNGRPFILAGHSQGSNMLLFVLSEYMKQHPEYYERMIAAYVIGYSVTQEFLSQNPHLKFAQAADDTGVIISYNTEAPDLTEKNPVVLENSVVINPISWTVDETTADASQNLGSLIDGKKVDNLADATVDKNRGVLICSAVNPEDFYSASGIFPMGVYHSSDYAFYYYNLMDNVQKRIDSFLSK